jgi:hypothetical protein
MIAWLDREAWNAVREARVLSWREARLWDMVALGPFVLAVTILILLRGSR